MNLLKMKNALPLTVGLFIPVLGQAQTTSGQSFYTVVNDVMSFMMQNILLVIGALVIIGALVVMYRTLFLLLEIEKRKVMEEKGMEVPELSRYIEEGPSWLEQLNAWMWKIAPISKEKEIDLGHDYDGIRELDNRLPPWWLGLMYGSIVFAFVYMYYYHWSDTDWSSTQEYEMAMVQAEKEKRAYLLQVANSVDESNVEFLEDEASLAAGETIFLSKCASCHGQLGEGGVGPNFTDPYWIHGGSISDIFSTIKYGVPEKGMISWQSQLRPKNMQQVASFIKTLQGTNPPNQKEKEGTLYQDDQESQANEATETAEG